MNVKTWTSSVLQLILQRIFKDFSSTVSFLFPRPGGYKLRCERSCDADPNWAKCAHLPIFRRAMTSGPHRTRISRLKGVHTFWSLTQPFSNACRTTSQDTTSSCNYLPQRTQTTTWSHFAKSICWATSRPSSFWAASSCKLVSNYQHSYHQENHSASSCVILWGSFGVYIGYQTREKNRTGFPGSAVFNWLKMKFPLWSPGLDLD